MIDIFVDIETIPNQSPEYRAMVRNNIKAPAQYKKQDSIDAWLAENAETATDEAIAKTSFDPALGHIACIGWAIGDGQAQCYDARNVEEEVNVLEAFFHQVQASCGVHTARWIGHYISGFDLRFLLNRAIVLGVKLPSALTFPRDIKPWSDQVFDTMVAWAGPKGSISQDNLAKAFGLAGKGDFDGSMVAEAWANGEHDKIASYCLSDVETVREIYWRFKAVGY